MQKAMFTILLCFCIGIVGPLAGCKSKELSQQEKQKVADIKVEIERIEAETIAAEKELQPNLTGLIPLLTQARIETDKLTVSILRQYAAAIESGGEVTISVQATAPNKDLLPDIEKEIREVEAELNKTIGESSAYSGGLIKALIDTRAETQKLTLTALRQKFIAAKYGLFIPAFSFDASVPAQAEAMHGSSGKNQIEAAAEAKEKIDDPGPFDFKRTRWGMSKAEVMQREELVLHADDENLLVYRDEVLGHKASLMYSFINDELYSTGYVLDDDQYSNLNRYADAYVEIVKFLTEKYGEPKNKRDVWSNNLFKDDYERRGTAYSLGHVTSVTEWERDDDEIKVVLGGNNHKINGGIIYESKTFRKEKDNMSKERQSSKF